jgi:hypothetical protein
MKKLIFIAVGIICLLTACKKDKKEYTIKGKFVAYPLPSKQPVLPQGLANKTIYLVQGTGGSRKELASTTVASDGSFTFVYSGAKDAVDGADMLKIQLEAGLFGLPTIFGGIPVKVNIDNLEAIAGAGGMAVYNLVVNLNALNSYSSSDTLEVAIPLHYGVRIAGPFTNQRLFVVSPKRIEDVRYEKNNESIGIVLNRNKPTVKFLDATYVVPNSYLKSNDTVYVNAVVR